MDTDKRNEWDVEIILNKARYFIAKRIFDLMLGSFLLLIFAPIMLLVGLAILVFDGRPVFFRQQRIGRNGRTFSILKFRTMYVHDFKSDHQYNWGQEVPDQFIFKSTNNPNITKLGSSLRKYSLDELPQVINVLKGDMSIVGPRPEIPEITKYYNDHQKKRLVVKPGITGYAQVNGRAELNHGEKIAYDLYYVYNCSLMLDFKVIWQTFIQVIISRGSY